MNEIVGDLDLFLSKPDNIITLAYLCGGAFLCLVALEMTNRIIIYRDVADFIKINGMPLYRSKPDEDGDIKLELVMGMRNVSDIHFDKVELKMTLNDRKGAEIDHSTDYGQLPPYSGRVMKPWIWGLSEARLKNCTFNISLDIYQPVAYATFTATLQKE